MLILMKNQLKIFDVFVGNHKKQQINFLYLINLLYKNNNVQIIEILQILSKN